MNGPMMVGPSVSTRANQIHELGEYVCVDGSKGGGAPPQLRFLPPCKESIRVFSAC